MNQQQGYDTKRGSTSGLFGEDGHGLTGGIFNERAMLQLQEQFFPPKDQVPYSPAYPDAPTKAVTGKKNKS